MSKYKKHIFICENIRDESDTRGSCGKCGGVEIREKMKERIKELGLTQTIRVNSAGCLGACPHGPVAVVYPEGRWYGEIELADVEEIIQKDLVSNETVKRLEIEDDY